MINGLTLYPTCHGAVVGITGVIAEGRLVRLREIWPPCGGAWGQFLGTREALPLRGNDTRTDATFFAGCGKKSGKGGKGVFFAGGHARQGMR